jgi:hypothetical protein
MPTVKGIIENGNATVLRRGSMGSSLGISELEPGFFTDSNSLLGCIGFSLSLMASPLF